MIFTAKELSFVPVRLDTLPRYRDYFVGQGKLCDYSVGGVYMWDKWFGYEIAELDGILFVRGRDTQGCGEQYLYYPPLGKSIDDTVRGIDILLDAYGDITLFPVDKATFDLISTRYDCSNVVEYRDCADYLYDITKLATLTGKAYHKKKNLVNGFISTYDYAVESISQGNIPMLKQWFVEYSKGDKAGILLAEYDKIVEVLDNYATYGLDGIVLYVDGSIAGFSMGEVIGDTVYVHTEKADKNIHGVYQALNMLYSDYVMSKYPVVLYSNREDDVGDEGLRQAKLSYNPIDILIKKSIKINNK